MPKIIKPPLNAPAINVSRLQQRPGVYVSEQNLDNHAISAAPKSICAFIGSSVIGPVNEPILLYSFAGYARHFGALSLDSATDNDFSAPGLEAAQEGIWALEKAEIFNLLCIPPLSLNVNSSSDVSSQTRSAAARLCPKHGAIFILAQVRIYTTFPP